MRDGVGSTSISPYGMGHHLPMFRFHELKIAGTDDAPTPPDLARPTCPPAKACSWVRWTFLSVDSACATEGRCQPPRLIAW